MNVDLVLNNFTNPAFLFFLLGIVAVQLRSDLQIPTTSSKFLSLYLLFAIGFRGGQELAHEHFSWSVVGVIGLGLASAVVIPLYSFFILRRRLNVYDAGAVAASYGSVSAVTFVTATLFLESMQQSLHGYMVATMAMMEAPAIIVGLLLINFFGDRAERVRKRVAIHHALTNGSVLMVLGSLFIGLLATEKQAAGIRPFTNDIFQGFLALFLLDMGVATGKNLKAFFKYGWFALLFALLMPLINGVVFAYMSGWFTDVVSDRFLVSVLAASASYIAVPAAMRIAVPKANPGLFLPMALGVTFPVNITIGLPLYYALVSNF
ncbi:sodium-dependent bicarbonate transport family permease [Thermonema rossianum]|uniref:sodium-dependent bicarbonate transport family permease n=1 Tax=Thermonema rossianum TaxID=55505 RepID=UPI00057156EE|nr:sodium-dependent bicarbonate transport family permease [Thermonema rossianum]